MENQAVQNPTPEPTLTPVQFSEPRSKFPAMYLILSLFVLILLASTVFLYYQNIQLKNMLAGYQTQPAISPTPATYQSPIPSTTTNPIINWKTYTNTKYSYNFQYPQQYNIKNNNAEGYDNNIATSAQLEVFNPISEPTLVFAVNAEQTNQDFATYSNTLFTTISTFKFPQSDKDYKNPLGSIEDNSVIAPIKKETINNMSAYTFTIRGNFIGTAGLPTKNPLTIKYVLFNSKGKMFILKVLNPTTDTNLLLSSFKFTN
jgi:hypothetical protein